MLPHSFGRKRIEAQFWSMFADRDLVDPVVGDVVVDEFERIYRNAGARLAFLASAPLALPRPSRSATTASTRASPSCSAPAMFVWGTHDRLVPAGFRRHVEQWLPAAEHIMLEGCGHVPQVERPEHTERPHPPLLRRTPTPLGASGAARAHQHARRRAESCLARAAHARGRTTRGRDDDVAPDGGPVRGAGRFVSGQDREAAGSGGGGVHGRQWLPSAGRSVAWTAGPKCGARDSPAS